MAFHPVLVPTSTRRARQKFASGASVRVEEQLTRPEQQEPSVFAGVVHGLPHLLPELDHALVRDRVVAQVQELHAAALGGQEELRERACPCELDHVLGHAELFKVAFVRAQAGDEGLGALGAERVAAQVQVAERLVGGEGLVQVLHAGGLEPVVGEAQVLQGRVALQRAGAERLDARVAQAAGAEVKRLQPLVLREPLAEVALKTLRVANVAAEHDLLQRRAIAQQPANRLEALGTDTSARQEEPLQSSVAR
mmetsp:Transcript_98496/g.278525  ORF Transcript_98496/g.278525 Transcript_98496/m.278525 type:complete len:252 (+) Transcript_98496:56-811(+)